MIDHSYRKYSSLYGSGQSRGGARPLIFRPNWSQGLDDPPPPTPLYLKVWNRHCTGTSVEQMPLTGSMIPE